MRPFGRRFRLLEPMRRFAADQLAAHGDHDALARRHASWCRDEVAHIGYLLTGHGEVDGVALLAELWPNLRTAVDWACTSSELALADALVRPIAAEVDLRRRAEIGSWAERILGLTPPEDEPGVAFWLLWAGHRHAQVGNHAAWKRSCRSTGAPTIRWPASTAPTSPRSAGTCTRRPQRPSHGSATAARTMPPTSSTWPACRHR